MLRNVVIEMVESPWWRWRTIYPPKGSSMETQEGAEKEDLDKWNIAEDLRRKNNELDIKGNEVVVRES